MVIVVVMNIRLVLVMSTVGIWQVTFYFTPDSSGGDTITLILFRHVLTVFCRALVGEMFLQQENINNYEGRNFFVFQFPVSQHNRQTVC